MYDYVTLSNCICYVSFCVWTTICVYDIVCEPQNLKSKWNVKTADRAAPKGRALHYTVQRLYIRRCTSGHGCPESRKQSSRFSIYAAPNGKALQYIVQRLTLRRCIYGKPTGQ